MSHVGNVCVRCASIKQRCGGGLPCARCQRLDIACVYRGGVSAAPVNPARVQPKLKRVRSGCASCKTRRKKCDEARPKCGDCKRLNLPCQWKGTPPLDQSCTPSLQEVVLPRHHSGHILEGSGVDALSCGPVNRHVIKDFKASLRAIDPPPVLVPVPSPTSNLSTLPSLNDIDRSLLNHYIKSVAEVFNRCPGESANPFVERLVPIAYSSNITLSALLSLSGVHWRRVYPKAYARGLVHQGRAISGLASMLRQCADPLEKVQATATVLLLCLGELADGKSTAWQYHLDAAGKLLAAESTRKVETPQTKFLYSLFHYLDAVATISSCKKPLLKSADSLEEHEVITEKRMLPDTDLALESIYGVPRGLFDFVGRMNSLAQRRSTRSDPESNERFKLDATLLGMDLDTWRFTYDSTNLASSPFENRKVHLASEALEWAIRLRLHQIVHGYDNTHPSARQATSKIMTAISAIRNGSRVEGCLLFPLVIAGASTDSEEQRIMVKERLMVMENTLGFGHITAALRLLEKVWKTRESQHTSSNKAPIVNWAEMRYNEFPGIVFV